MFSLEKNFATGIGSLPYLDAKEALDFVLSCFKGDIAFWPQLPKKSFLEQMMVQFSEKLPGVVIDLKNKNIFVDIKKKSFSREVEECFQNYLDGNLDYFSISPEYASGLYALCDKLKELQGLGSQKIINPVRDGSSKDDRLLTLNSQDKNQLSIKNNLNNIDVAKIISNGVKGQIVGPITLGMNLLDSDKQPVIYNSELKECLIKLLTMKAVWQIRKLKIINEKLKIILFIDEPYLSCSGLSFFTLKREDVIAALNEIIEAAHAEGAAVGIHCCGNTDWSLILSTGLDILSFDAYGYLDNLLLYRDALDKYLARGGILSFGIVPNNEEAQKAGIKEDLANRVRQAKDKLKIDRFLITSSCGCGTLDIGFSEKISRLSVETAHAFGD
ncbi:MAG: hypothetical protein Q8L26_04715 [Candidatus Omnitrophota bacterium]|nr:hypothetical protein [Candidatus Omnitrophota bacterium]